MKLKYYLFAFTVCLLMSACGGDILPKPKGMLSLEYPDSKYNSTSTPCDYIFEMNELGKLKLKEDCSAIIDYPMLDASIFLTYRAVNKNIDILLRDAQNLTYEHVRKADDIQEEKYINEEQNAYGMFYDVSGNAASQSQFYITDSTKHFITGSIYFNVKPNYDSIYPAAVYLKNDIRQLMETIEWKE